VQVEVMMRYSTKIQMSLKNVWSTYSPMNVLRLRQKHPSRKNILDEDARKRKQKH
jgi:hypothetical protein